jgi:hypothetical protein
MRKGKGHPVDIEMIEIGSSIMKNEEAPPMDDLLMNEEVLRMDENTNNATRGKESTKSEQTAANRVYLSFSS